MSTSLRTLAAAAILAAATCNLASAARAQPATPSTTTEPPHREHPCGEGHPGQGWGGHPGWLHALHLSDAQREQVFQVMHDHELALHHARTDAHSRREALHRAALAPQASSDQLAQLAAAAGSADGALALQMAQLDQALVAVLTPEQQQRLAACMASPRS